MMPPEPEGSAYHNGGGLLGLTSHLKDRLLLQSSHAHTNVFIITVRQNKDNSIRPRCDTKCFIKQEDKDSSIVPPRLLGSVRFTVLLFAFGAFMLFYYNMFNFSMGLVCMTGGNHSQAMSEGEFDWDKTITSNLLGAFFYGFISSQIAGGFFADYFGERAILVPGSLGLSVSALLMPVAARAHWGYLMALRVVQGTLSGFLLPATYNLLVTWSPMAERGMFVAVAFAGCPVATMLNYPVSSLLCLVGFDNGWPLVFYVPAVCILVWCALFYLITYKSPSQHPKISSEELAFITLNRDSPGAKDMKLTPPFRKLFISLPFYASCLATLGSSWAYFLIALNLPFFIDETFDVSIAMNGLLSAVPYMVVLLMTPTGALYDTLKAKNLMTTTNLNKTFNTIAFMGPVISFTTISLLPSNVQIVSFCIALAMLHLSWTGGYLLSFQYYAGPYAGLTYGIACTFGQLSGVVNPIAVAKMAPDGTTEQWANVFYLAGAIVAFTGIGYLCFASLELESWAVVEEKNNETKDITGNKDSPDYAICIRNKNE